jgi:D-threo-aldose 1-dehydrogenase
MSWRPASRIGLGGGPLGNLYAPLSDAAAEGALAAAWDGGVRHFDTAPLYGSGLAEVRLGRFLAYRPRDAFTLSTKVGRVLEPEPAGQGADATFPGRLPFVPRFDYSHDGVMRSFEASLRRLGVDRVDLLLLHDVDTVTHGAAQAERMALAMRSGIRAMQALRESGAVRAIGLGVNECAPCLEAMRHAEWDCFMVAGRYTLLEQGALEALLPACVQRGIGVLAVGIFNSGILAGGAVAGARYDYQPASPAILARVGRIEAISARHGVALPAAAVAFPLAHPAVVGIVVGARSAEEVAADLAMSRAVIPAALWDELKSKGLLAAEAPVPAGA